VDEWNIITRIPGTAKQEAEKNCIVKRLLRSSTFWNISPCDPEKVESSAGCPIHIGFLLQELFEPVNGGDVLPKRRLNFSGLHGVTSQKAELFFHLHQAL
jgi:hypothetical protein